MSVEVITRELAEFTSQAVELEIRGVSFGTVHISPEGCAVAWDGRLRPDEFLRLGEVLEEIASRMTAGQRELLPHYAHEATVVSFVLAEEADDGGGFIEYDLAEEADEHGGFVEYTLSDLEQLDRYQRRIEQPGNIAFVRCDLYDMSPLPAEPPHEYSFTADNPDLVLPGDAQSEIGELAVKLPRSHQWTDDLAAWMIEHHTQVRRLIRNKVTPTELAATIQELARA